MNLLSERRFLMMSSSKKFFGLRQRSGFTLVELMMVVAIIAILASVAYSYYRSYTEKSKVSTYAEPVARACIMDVLAWCAENPGGSIPTNLTNCGNTTTAFGTVTVDTSGISGSCDSLGHAPDDVTVSASLSGINSYSAKCKTKNSGVVCVVEK